MAKTVKIPDNMRPWEVTINGIKYVYPAGTTQEVPDEVAALIERISNVQTEKEPNMPPFAVGAQADMNAAEGEPGHVLNRTHYEAQEVVNEPLNITWDGNTEGLEYVQAFSGYKVSDAVLTEENLLNASLLITNENGEHEPTGEMTISKPFEGAIMCGGLDGTSGISIVVINDVIAAQIGASAGTYFTIGDVGVYGGTYVSSLTTTEPVEHTKTVVHKLDPKFLPDGVPYAEDLGVMEILPETEVVTDGGMAILENAISGVTAGEKYIVKYNGIEYEATAFEQIVDGVTLICLGNAGALMGNAGTGEPFAIVILPDGVGIAAIDGATELTISIKGKAVIIQKLDKRCLPNDSGFAKMFTVNVKGKIGERTSDKTFSEITSAVNDGNTIVRMLVETSDYTRDVLHLARYTPAAVFFGSEYAADDSGTRKFRSVRIDSDNSVHEYHSD